MSTDRTGHRDLDLEARASRQLTVQQLFGTPLQQGLHGLSVVTVEGVGALPYVSIVDEVTGDPTNWW